MVDEEINTGGSEQEKRAQWEAKLAAMSPERRAKVEARKAAREVERQIEAEARKRDAEKYRSTLLGRNAEPKHVFVGGSPHSGTSLITAMLGAHPEIYAIPYEANPAGSSKEAQDKIHAAAAKCDKPGIKFICEKTPNNILKVDNIKAAFPGAKFVLTIRDPRDVACSIKRRTGNLDDGIEKWRASYSNLMDLVSRSDCFLLSYESLIADAETMLTHVCNFIGLTYSASMLEYWKDDRDWFRTTERRDIDAAASNRQTIRGANHKVRRNWQIHQPIMKNRVGTYQQELSDREIARIEAELGRFASQFGYALTAPESTQRIS